MNFKSSLILCSYAASILSLGCLVLAIGVQDALLLMVLALVLAFAGVIAGWIGKKRAEAKEIVAARRVTLFGLFILLIVAYGICSNAFESLLSSWAFEAHQSGEMAKQTQEIYHQKHGTYAKGLDELIDVNPKLCKYAEVTFSFVHVSVSGFTIRTLHKDYWKAYTFTEKVD